MTNKQGIRAGSTPSPVEDLDALLASRSLKPATVKLGDREWTIKRDLTPGQVIGYWQLVAKGESVRAFAVIVGDADAQAMHELFDALPVEMATAPLRRLYQISGLLKRTDDSDSDADGVEPGESTAS